MMWRTRISVALGVAVLGLASGCLGEPKAGRYAASEVFEREIDVALIDAVFKHDEAKARELIAKGADPNAWSRTGVWGTEPDFRIRVMPFVLGGADLDALDLLLKVGADPNIDVFQTWPVSPVSRKDSGLSNAATSELAGALDVVLRHGPDLNRVVGRKSALGHAASMDRWDSVRTLLDAGADPNVAHETGGDPMGPAIASAKFDIVLLLLERGYITDLNIVAAQTQTRSVAERFQSTCEQKKAVLEWLHRKGIPMPDARWLELQVHFARSNPGNIDALVDKCVPDFFLPIRRQALAKAGLRN